MKSIVTFTWSVSIETDKFDENDEKQVDVLRSQAWLNVQRSDGELTDIQLDDSNDLAGNPLIG